MRTLTGMDVGKMEDELRSTVVEVQCTGGGGGGARSANILEVQCKKLVCAWNFTPALSGTILFFIVM